MKKYFNGEYVELTEEEIEEAKKQSEIDKALFGIPQEPTQEDRIEAQVLYTALMTDTLLEGQTMFEKIKRFYKLGLYTKEQVFKFFEKGVITEEQFKETVKG